MNLKEAFRFQNKLQSLMEEGKCILGRDQNITNVKSTYLRKKVMAEAEDETMMEQPTTEYSEKITEVAGFLLYLLGEREKLSAAIQKAKMELNMPAGYDGEIGLNGIRQELAALFRRMSNLRSSETLISNGGTGYRFNNEGNQVSYRCDVKRVVTINFDRNKIRKMCGDLSKQADNTSNALDAALVNSQVAYEAPFDVNETFAETFEKFMGEQASA